MYNFSPLEGKIDEVIEWFSREASLVRTGRATPAILDGVKVDSYGSMVAINHVAGVTTEDARTLRVTPWDKENTKEIEKAINMADLGLSVVVDDQGLRVVFPELTTERRQALLKVLKTKCEEARVSIRQARDDCWNEIQSQTKEGTLSEDAKFKGKDEMEKRITSANEKLEAMVAKKEKELSS